MSLNLALGSKTTSGVAFHQFGVNIDTDTDTVPAQGLFFDGLGDARKIPDGLASFLFAKSIQIQVEWAFAGSSWEADDEVNVGTIASRNDEGFGTITDGSVISIHKSSMTPQSATSYNYDRRTETSNGGLSIRFGRAFTSTGIFRPVYYALLDKWTLPEFSFNGLNQTFDEDGLIDEQFGVGFFAPSGSEITTTVKGFGADWKIAVEEGVTIQGDISVASSLPEY